MSRGSAGGRRSVGLTQRAAVVGKNLNDHIGDAVDWLGQARPHHQPDTPRQLEPRGAGRGVRAGRRQVAGLDFSEYHGVGVQGDRGAKLIHCPGPSRAMKRPWRFPQ